MDGLKPYYMKEAVRSGISIKVFNRNTTGLQAKIKNVEAMVIFTNKVSHNAKKKAVATAKAKNIPVFMFHSCGLCTLRDCLDCIKRTEV